MCVSGIPFPWVISQTPSHTHTAHRTRTPHTAHRKPHTAHAHRTPHTAHRTPHTAHAHPFVRQRWHWSCRPSRRVVGCSLKPETTTRGRAACSSSQRCRPCSWWRSCAGTSVGFVSTCLIFPHGTSAPAPRRQTRRRVRPPTAHAHRLQVGCCGARWRPARSSRPPVAPW